MNTSLSITISPPFRFQNGTNQRNPYKNVYEEDKSQIKSILKYIRCGTYILYPEFDPKGRLHYHGIINLDINQKIRYYKYAYCKLKMGNIYEKRLGINKRYIRIIKTINKIRLWKNNKK